MDAKSYAMRNLFRCAHCEKLKNANRRAIHWPICGMDERGQIITRMRICKDCFVSLMGDLWIETP